MKSGSILLPFQLAQEPILAFLKKEARAGSFTPRKEVPLRLEPLNESEASIYFKVLGHAWCTGNMPKFQVQPEDD